MPRDDLVFSKALSYMIKVSGLFTWCVSLVLGVSICFNLFVLARLKIILAFPLFHTIS